MKHFLYILLLLSMGGFLASCGPKDEPSGYMTTPFDLQTPSHLPVMKIPEDNPLTIEGVELGRMLYYDPILHETQDHACASCHEQSTSFTTYSSNALIHVNLGYANKFLWNGAVEGSLEDIMLFEVKDFFKADLEVINADPIYRDKFKKAFGVEEITNKELAYALAQFERTKFSGYSKYDLYRIGATQFTAQEIRGLNLYFSEKGDCFHCHGTSLLTNNDFHNTGLDANPDQGRMEVTSDPKDLGKFKTPTLRNIALTAPYMHDGRFSTLEEVVEFYSTGLINSPTIDPLMKQINNGGLQLTTEEKADLVAFLQTFTDTAFVNNPALSDPF
ncbi:MAG: c-type cytochrome [Bacteroidia bacterium]